MKLDDNRYGHVVELLSLMPYETIFGNVIKMYITY